MSKNLCAIVVATVLVAALPCSADQAKAARDFGDDVLAKLVAYKTEPARSDLEAAKADHGSTVPYKVAWALMLAEEGKLDESIKHLKQAADADKKDPAADYYRGEVLYWKKKKSDANAAWKQAGVRAQKLVDASPEDARANYYLGAALVRQKKFDQARKALKAAKDNGFSKALVHYQTGLSYAFAENWEKAKEALDKAIAADSGLAHAYYYRGLVWKQLKRTDQMMLDLDRFLKLAPKAREASTARSLLKAGGG